MGKAIYFFCGSLELDPVAKHVWDAVSGMYPLAETAADFEGNKVYEYKDAAGHRYHFVQTRDVLSHIYSACIDELTEKFSDYDFAGVVNWHAGANAPDNILTVHSIGDVPTGNYAPTDPMLYRNMLNALAHAVTEYGLEGWTACTEATHWSGVVYGENDPADIPKYRVPNYDIEIGSTEECWSNPEAAKAVAAALTHVFDSDERPKTLLAAGGVHFESAFSNCGLYEDVPVMCAHILPNQWLVSGEYTGEEGFRKIRLAAESILGGIDGVSFHDNLQGPYKATARAIAEEKGVPSFKHKVLRDKGRTKEALGL